MLRTSLTLPADTKQDEINFVISLKDEYVNSLQPVHASYPENQPDVVKLDFERLADFIRFEALKQNRLLTIDRIKTILTP